MRTPPVTWESRRRKVTCNRVPIGTAGNELFTSFVETVPYAVHTIEENNRTMDRRCSPPSLCLLFDRGRSLTTALSSSTPVPPRSFRRRLSISLRQSPLTRTTTSSWLKIRWTQATARFQRSSWPTLCAPCQSGPSVISSASYVAERRCRWGPDVSS